MRLATILKTSTVVASLAVPSLSAAQGVPTSDARNLLQELQNYQVMLDDLGIQTDQLDSLVEQVQLLENQLQQLEDMYALLSDPSQVIGLVMGDGLDGILEGEFNADMVGTIISGAQGDWSGIGGSNASEVVSRITGALESAGTSQDEITELASSGNPIAENNATATASGAATSAAAEIAYEEANVSRTRIVRLIDEIPQLDSLKKSVDHNTRVTAELAISMASLWQLESVQTMNDGMGGVLDAATAAEIQKYNDFTLPSFD